jgi:hypothetical protein
MSEPGPLEKLEQKPREQRTALEQCIIDATKLEDMRDGDYGPQVIAAAELARLREIVEAARQVRSCFFELGTWEDEAETPAYEDAKDEKTRDKMLGKLFAALSAAQPPAV